MKRSGPFRPAIRRDRYRARGARRRSGYGPLVALAACILAAQAGCRLPGHDGPVSESLASARRLSQRGVFAMERDQQPQAEQFLAKAVKTCPKDPEARRYYAEALRKRGAVHEALEQLHQAERLDPENPVLQTRLADLLRGMGRLDEAMLAADKAVDLNPKSAEAWAAHGRVLWTRGQLQAALADLHRAAGYAPEDRGILLDLAEVYRQLGEHDRALMALQSTVESYPPGEEPAELLERVAVEYASLDRHADAATTLAAACERAAPSAERLCRLAEQQLLAGQPSVAESTARRALNLDPNHTPSRELLGRALLAESGRPSSRLR